MFKKINLPFIFFFLSMMCLLWCRGTFAEPLSADQAFSFSLRKEAASQLFAEWQIAPGYYLYAKRVRITTDPVVPMHIQLPEGEWHENTEHQREHVYANVLRVPILFEVDSSQAVLKVQVQYQGCSREGFCYPPVQKSILLDTKTLMPLDTQVVSGSFSGLMTLANSQYQLSEFLQEKSMLMTLLLFMGLGLLLAFTPCVLPMIPILASIIVGEQHKINTHKAFFLSLAYVLGMALTYAAAGVLAAFMGYSLQLALHTTWVMIFMSTVLALLALSLFDIYVLPFSKRLQQKVTIFNAMQSSGRYSGAFMMGLISTLIISPCVTAPLIGVLLFIAATGNVWMGAATLFAMGIGMGIPLLLVGTSVGKWLPKSGAWMKGIKIIFGLLLFAMSLGFLSRAVSLQGGLPTFNQAMRMQDRFILVRNLDEVNHQLHLAKLSAQPVILDFYADWCESCIEMDKTVFKAKAVEKALSSYRLLRVDLSQNSEADQALIKHFQVIAPPTVLFFNAKGHELIAERIAGIVDEKEFLARVIKIKP